MFNISLTLTSNYNQVRIGRDRAIGMIRDSTGNEEILVSIESNMINKLCSCDEN